MQLQLGSWRSVGNGGCRGKRWKKRCGEIQQQFWGMKQDSENYTCMLLVCVSVFSLLCVGLYKQARQNSPCACELGFSSDTFNICWASPFGHARSLCLSSLKEVCSREVSSNR